MSLCKASHDWQLLDTGTFDMWKFVCKRCDATKVEWIERGEFVTEIKSKAGVVNQFRRTIKVKGERK